MSSNQKPIVGADYAGRPVTQIVATEKKITANVVTGEVDSLIVPYALSDRRLYVYLYPVMAGNAYLIGEVNLYLGTQQVGGGIPVSVGNAAGVAARGKTLITAANSIAFSSSVPPPPADSISVTLSGLLAGETTSAFLIPLYVRGQFDRAVFSIKEITGVTAYRLVMALVNE